MRIETLTRQDSGQGLDVFVLAIEDDGAPIGLARLGLPRTSDVDWTSTISVHVHPANRRQRVGARLIESVVRTAVSAGRRTIEAEAEVDGGGHQFLMEQGFRPMLELVYASLDVAEVDWAELEDIATRPRPGYRVQAWSGSVPDFLAESFARSRRAMDDMPMGDADVPAKNWTTDEVRRVAKAVADRGEHLDTVAIIDDESDEVVAFTELVVGADGTGCAQHYGTAVLPRHRGHQLGLVAKAHSLRRAIEAFPALTSFDADTAVENAPMRRINSTLGFRPTRRTVHMELHLASD